MDVVEIAPAYDVAEITALAAATIAWDYLALLAPPPKIRSDACLTPTRPAQRS
jgi:hypothetical protein